MTAASLRYLGYGAEVTLCYAAASIALSAVIGLGLAALRLYAWPPLRMLAAGYATVIRGVPLLILLIGAYYSLPYLGLDLSMTAVVIGVTGLYYGAYMGEVFRAAIGSVPRAQWDAGRSVGFRGVQTFRIVILPQARRLCVAPFLNTALGVIKATALVTAIGGWELLAAGNEIGDRTGDPMTAYLAVAAIYFLLCFPLARLAARLERTAHG